MQWSHSTTPRSGQYLMHVHSHITRAVAAMDSCFVLVRTHQHGIARRKGLTEDHRPRRLLPRRVQKHSFKRQHHSVNVVAVIWLCACVRYWPYRGVVLSDHCIQMVYFPLFVVGPFTQVAVSSLCGG